MTFPRLQAWKVKL